MTDTDTWETITGCRPLRSCWQFAFLYDYWLRRWKVTGSNLSYMYKYGFLFILSRNRTPRGVACTSSIFKPIYLYNNNLTNITEQLLKLSVFKILLKRKCKFVRFMSKLFNRFYIYEPEQTRFQTYKTEFNIKNTYTSKMF